MDSPPRDSRSSPVSSNDGLEQIRNSCPSLFTFIVRVEYTNTLEPSESTTSEKEDFQIIEAFQNNFIYPLASKTKIKIGKGLASTLGKIIGEYFAKIIIVEFLLSLWGFIEVGLPNLPEIVSTIMNIASISIIAVIFIMMIVQSRSGKKKDIDIEELDGKMRKRRSNKFGSK